MCRILQFSGKNNIRSSFSLRATMLPNLKWTQFFLYSVRTNHVRWARISLTIPSPYPLTANQLLRWRYAYLRVIYTASCWPLCIFFMMIPFVGWALRLPYAALHFTLSLDVNVSVCVYIYVTAEYCCAQYITHRTRECVWNGWHFTLENK